MNLFDKIDLKNPFLHTRMEYTNEENKFYRIFKEHDHDYNNWV